MEDRESVNQRLLGDIPAEPIELSGAPMPRYKEWLERPVPLGWLLLILAAFLIVILIIT